MTTTLDLLHRLIRRQIDTIGVPVTNLYGTAAGETTEVSRAQVGAWRVVAVAQEVAELEQLFAVFRAADAARTWTATTTDGVLVVPESGLSTTPEQYLLLGQVTVPAATIVPLAVDLDSMQSWVAVYVDGVLQRRGFGSLEIRLAMDGGTHTIELLAKASQLGVAIPTSVLLRAAELVPTPTGLTAASTTDSTSGRAQVELTWYNNARAGGWRVLRRRIAGMGILSTFSAADNNGTFTAQIAGDWRTTLAVGDEVYANRTVLGTVLEVAYDSTLVATTVRVRLVDSVADVVEDWAGRTAGVSQVSEVARVTRMGSAQTVTWVDTAVGTGEVWDYALQAFGLFDGAGYGARSAWLSAIAGDLTPPDVVTFATGFPKVSDQLVVARFTTPDDVDYAGVRVYFVDEPVTGVATGAGSGDNTLEDSGGVNPAWTTGQYNTYYVEITGGVGAGQVMLITGTIAPGSLEVATDWNTKPAAGSEYRIIRYVPVITDYGLPDTRDELKFSPIGLGRYEFRAFDLAGNEQTAEDAAAWIARAIAPPQTTLTTQDVDESGCASSSVVAVSLACYPGFSTIKAEATSGTGHTANTLNHTGAFVASAYASNDVTHTYFYVRITDKAGIGQVRRVVDNTTGALTVTPAWAVTPPDSSKYEIVDGATLRRWGGIGGFLGVFQPEYVSRPLPTATPSTLLLDYYTELTGFPPEPTRRVVIDADTSPSCAVTVAENPASSIQVNIVPDDDVREWWLYARKNSSPLVNGVPDEQYLRFQRPVSVTEVTMATASASGDMWYVAVVPVSSLTELGEPVTATLVINGAGSTDPLLSDRVVEPHDNAPDYYNRIKWNHNAAAEYGAGIVADAAVKIYAYRDDQGVASTVELTAGTTRYAWQDSEHDDEYSNSDDDYNDPESAGSFIHALDEARGDAETGVYRTWFYEIKLYKESGVLVATYNLSRSDYFVPVGPTVVYCVATEIRAGAESGGVCSTTHANEVAWSIASPDDVHYYLDLEVAKDEAGAVFTLLVHGLSTHAYQYSHEEWGKCSGGTGTEYWTYRVKVMLMDGTYSGESATSSRVTSNVMGTCNHNDE